MLKSWISYTRLLLFIYMIQLENTEKWLNLIILFITNTNIFKDLFDLFTSWNFLICLENHPFHQHIVLESFLFVWKFNFDYSSMNFSRFFEWIYEKKREKKEEKPAAFFQFLFCILCKPHCHHSYCYIHAHNMLSVNP